MYFIARHWASNKHVHILTIITIAVQYFNQWDMLRDKYLSGVVVTEIPTMRLHYESQSATGSLVVADAAVMIRRTRFAVHLTAGPSCASYDKVLLSLSRLYAWNRAGRWQRAWATILWNHLLNNINSTELTFKKVHESTRAILGFSSCLGYAGGECIHFTHPLWLICLTFYIECPRIINWNTSCTCNWSLAYILYIHTILAQNLLCTYYVFFSSYCSLHTSWVTTLKLPIDSLTALGWSCHQCMYDSISCCI